MSLDSSAPPPTPLVGPEPPRHVGDPPPRRMGGTHRGAPPPGGGGSFPRAGGLGGLSHPRGRRRGKVHGSGGVVVAAEPPPPPGRGGGHGHGLPPPGRCPASMQGRAGWSRARPAGPGGGSRLYTPGGDFSVMPLSTSSIRSSSITTAGTGGEGGAWARGRAQPLPPHTYSPPGKAPDVPPRMVGQRGAGGCSGDGERVTPQLSIPPPPSSQPAASGCVVWEGGAGKTRKDPPPLLCGRS